MLQYYLDSKYLEKQKVLLVIQLRNKLNMSLFATTSQKKKKIFK